MGKPPTIINLLINDCLLKFVYGLIPESLPQCSVYHVPYSQAVYSEQNLQVFFVQVHVHVCTYCLIQDVSYFYLFIPPSLHFLLSLSFSLSPSLLHPFSISSLSFYLPFLPPFPPSLPDLVWFLPSSSRPLTSRLLSLKLNIVDHPIPIILPHQCNYCSYWT